MRKNGIYWVQITPNIPYEPAKFKDGYWFLIASNQPFTDAYFEDIKETEVTQSSELNGKILQLLDHNKSLRHLLSVRDLLVNELKDRVQGQFQASMEFIRGVGHLTNALTEKDNLNEIYYNLLKEHGLETEALGRALSLNDKRTEGAWKQPENDLEYKGGTKL